MNSVQHKQIQNLLTYNDSTDTDILHSTLTQIYAHCPYTGIPTNLIIEIIPFLCNADFISISTRVYIIERCLLPRGFLPASIVLTVAKRLGIQSPQNPYKPVTPIAVQVALCKWLCHVYPIIVDANDAFKKTYAIWFQLWMFDYLQDWITYLLLWSTTSRSQIVGYRVNVLLKFGLHPGYANSRALATLLLYHYSRLNPTEQVQSSINKLKCNAKRLASVQNFPIDETFVDNASAVLSQAGAMSKELFKDVMTSHLDALKLAIPSDSHGSTITGTAIENNLTLQQFAGQIEKYQVPVDYLSTLVGTGYKRLLLAFLSPEAKESFKIWTRIAIQQTEAEAGQLTSIFRLLRAAGDGKIEFEDLLETSSFSRLYNLRSLHLMPLVSEIDSSPAVIKKLFAKYNSLYDKWSIDLYFFNIGLSLLLLCQAHDNRRSSFLLQIYSTFMENYVSAALVKRHSPRELILLLSPSLDASEKIPADWFAPEELASFFILPRVIDNIMAMNDALVMSVLCKSLVVAKGRVKGLPSDNLYVKALNKCIIDMSTYLWRNKIFTESTTWGLPREFWQKITDSLYLSDPNISQRHLFTIPYLYPFRFVCQKLFREMEDDYSCDIRYDRPLTDDGYRSWTKHMQTNGKRWLEGVTDYDTLRKMLVLQFNEREAYYSITLFLQTYVRNFPDRIASLVKSRPN
ncbi:HCL243Wp [Eremothecium sinecaudum]|uniref:HCL243Wp n=1 Tax=Eremothecium sinecaudum TaxID=45286 RepID=A0A109UYX4_9SACH|nr:HCL243Wp [Eremothecium sinecaudum]AMD19908.1 HCL243Wp [Eremothecium sinecaudum]